MSKPKIGLIALLVGIVLGTVGTYAWATRQTGTIEQIRAQADSLMAAVDLVREMAEDSIAALEDSLAHIEVKRDTIEIRITEAGGAVTSTGGNLEEHLTLREDTAGLRLWDEHKQADAHLAALWQEERTVWQQQIEMRVQLEAQLRNVIASQDTELVALRGNFLAMQAEAERWRLKAEPPWAIRVAGDALEAGLVGTAAGFASKDQTVGLVTAAVAFAVKQLPEIKVPFF
jgi:hypothetical protein